MTDIKTALTVDLTGRTAVITGGSGVLCSDMAETLAARGAAVVILGRRQERADAVAQRIITKGGRALAFACDIMDKAALEQVCKDTEAAFGPIDILINGAGGNAPGATAGHERWPENGEPPPGNSFFDFDKDALRGVLDVNFVGTVMVSQVFGRAMLPRRRGCIINIASMSGIRPLTKVGSYSAAKAAVANFTQWLAVYLGQTGIRVNAIAPGFFLTDQNRALLTNGDGTLTARGETIVAHTPMRRFGQASDLRGVLLWLVSDDAAFVTGTVIPVDGGFSAFSGV